MLRPCSARSSNASPIEPTWGLASPSVDDGAEAPPSPQCRLRSATRRSLDRRQAEGVRCPERRPVVVKLTQPAARVGTRLLGTQVREFTVATGTAYKPFARAWRCMPWTPSLREFSFTA
jgi:hypothetical protein